MGEHAAGKGLRAAQEREAIRPLRGGHGAALRPEGQLLEGESLHSTPADSAWQIWNEPAGFLGFGDRTIFWAEPYDSALPTYVKMLRASRDRIKAADKSAQIVLAGFYGQSWNTMAQLYKPGARKLLDTVTTHPYARTVSNAGGDPADGP